MMNPDRRRIQLLVALVAFATLGLTQLLSAYAAGVLYVSPVGNDANDCLTMSSACKTIVAAVSKASAGDTIIIAAGTYTEGIGINKNLTLIGFGADATIIYQGRISVSSATVRIYDLAITGAYGGDVGGGLYNDKGNVTLGHTAVLSNVAGWDGAGIYNYLGTLTLDHSTVAGNVSFHYGGGISNEQGNVTVVNSSILNNFACEFTCSTAGVTQAPATRPANGYIVYGGGIYNYGVLTVTDSTFGGNYDSYTGGGLRNDGTATLINVTLTGNLSGYGGGGVSSYGPLTLTNVTFSNDSSPYWGYGVALAVDSNNAWLRNTIIANTIGGSNCYGPVTSLGHNLSSDGSCNLNASGDMTNTNPLLGPLQDNGGPTPTEALLPGSPAINRGDNYGCPATDQRGIARPQAGVCDIGANEFVFPYALFEPVIMR